LPDLEKSNIYNDKLKYLYRDYDKSDSLLVQIEKDNHPKNSFLEELNKEENINKMWDKISGDYISYYSTVT